ncbi:hypothetical protein OG782_04715 [Streptomyces sp. NBC_00876]|uniref:hypothetical protein n=1 Tax=Streptomyces sp. NBC_00876 TaxID=2975853 RepID=UPI0038635899|nr:hypothetical protein OG782_04715 [Streptomyces sp. NBC_00876]
MFTFEGRIGDMDSEMMVAVVGGGGALLGAVIGGAAAVVSASIQGKRTAEAARSAYQGSLNATRRTAQQQAYTNLLSVLNEYEAATGGILAMACELIEELTGSLSGDPQVLDNETKERYRGQIREARDPVKAIAAVRYVGLEGPAGVHRAAKEVQAAVIALARVLGGLEETIDHGEGHWTAAMHGYEPVLTHARLRSAIDTYADTASTHLNGSSEVSA